MAKDLLNTYKYGWKTSYYQNTMDGKVEDVIQEPLPQDPFDDDDEKIAMPVPFDAKTIEYYITDEGRKGLEAELILKHGNLSKIDMLF